MTRRDILREKHEDAYFALLMDQVAESEGMKALDELERLNADSTFAVPNDAHHRMLKLIVSKSRFCRLQRSGRSFLKVFQKIAVIAMLGTLLFTVSFALSPALRNRTVNFLMEVFPESTDFLFYMESPGQITASLSFGWLPEGFELVASEEIDGSSFYIYQNSSDGYLEVACTQYADTAMSVDTEDATVTTVEINGMEAMLIQKEADTQLVWVIPDEGIVIAIVGCNLSADDLIEVVSNISY